MVHTHTPVLVVLTLLTGVLASKDFRSRDPCDGVAERCRLKTPEGAEDRPHCTQDGTIYLNRCEYEEGTCRTQSPLQAQGDACLQADILVTDQYATDEPERATRAKRTVSWRHRPGVNAYENLGTFETRFIAGLKKGIDDRLELSNQNGVPAETAKKMFSVRDHDQGRYERNLDCWAYGLGLSAISPWNSHAGPMMGGTLLSPRHLIWARHFSLPVNATLRFVDDSNRVFERRLVDLKVVDEDGDNSFFGEDLAVGVLDSDLPSTVDFVRVLPKDILFFRPPNSTVVPVFGTDQEGKALVANLAFQRFYATVTRRPKDTLRAPFHERKVGGDSGQPALAVLDGQLILLFANTLGGSGTGTPIVSYFDVINRMMEEMGGGYQLTTIQLDNYGDRSNRPSAYEAQLFTQRQ